MVKNPNMWNKLHLTISWIFFILIPSCTCMFYIIRFFINNIYSQPFILYDGYIFQHWLVHFNDKINMHVMTIKPYLYNLRCMTWYCMPCIYRTNIWVVFYMKDNSFWLHFFVNQIIIMDKIYGVLDRCQK